MPLAPNSVTVGKRDNKQRQLPSPVKRCYAASGGARSSTGASGMSSQLAHSYQNPRRHPGSLTSGEEGDRRCARWGGSRAELGSCMLGLCRPPRLAHNASALIPSAHASCSHSFLQACACASLLVFTACPTVTEHKCARGRRGSGGAVLCEVLHQRQRRVQLQGPQGEAAQHQALPPALQRQLQPLRQACSSRGRAGESACGGRR